MPSPKHQAIACLLWCAAFACDAQPDERCPTPSAGEVAGIPAPADGSGKARCVDPATNTGRATANAIVRADDAFGTSVGRESIGIYTAGSVRGFSAVAAGNVRINSMYFDQIQPLYPMMREATNIRIGLSATASPFPAPTGIVDYTLLTPKAVPSTSATAAIDSWGGVSVQIDRDQPLLASLRMAGAIGLYRNEFRNGTDNAQVVSALAGRWAPNEQITVQPFWQHSTVRDDDTGPLYMTAGNYLPPEMERRRFAGPSWLDANSRSDVYGVVANVAISPRTQLHAGIFHSRIDMRTDAANLYVGVDRDGYGRQIAILDPPSAYTATSGETRLTRAFVHGKTSHQLHLNLRARRKERTYDGSSEIDLGPARIGARRDIERPEVRFQEQSRYALRQASAGVAYRGLLGKALEVGAGVQKVRYEKTTTLPGLAPASSRSDPWLYNLSVVGMVGDQLSVYGGLVKGLEENGVAPASAANRNQPLQAIETSQRDLGVRWQIHRDMRLIVGAFDIEKPYFQTGNSGTFEPLGSIGSRGLELSLSGKLRPNLTVVAGGVLMRAEVTGPQVAAGAIGSHPVGIPDRVFRLNMDWKPDAAGGALSFDMGAAHASAKWANRSNTVRIPARTIVDLGARYRIASGDRNMLLRFVVSNVFDTFGFEALASGLYDTIPGRQAFLSLTADF
ncbi:TonB-dependent receptor [Lysobacter hankyongensis]|uniref:TonB-dependent receptor n=1 Tax=Lysobacter hankyongensis TaxID=1176535 RepID=A0ABP9C282_9GAMM